MHKRPLHRVPKTEETRYNELHLGAVVVQELYSSAVRERGIALFTFVWFRFISKWFQDESYPHHPHSLAPPDLGMSRLHHQRPHDHGAPQPRDRHDLCAGVKLLRGAGSTPEDGERDGQR